MKIAIIGAGFYGVSLALALAEKGHCITVFEVESNIMARASQANQARIHNGYHYTRSFLTAHRSRINSEKFITKYKAAISQNFSQVYAVAKNFSHINAKQFYTFCQTIGAPVEVANNNTKNLFQNQLVEEVFKVEEYAFDVVKLREILLEQLHTAKVKLNFGTQVNDVSATEQTQIRITSKAHATELAETFDQVFVAAYGQTNELLRRSNLPGIPLKYEWAELALVQLPPELEKLAITIVDGPFWSCTPFPSTQQSILSHVRYTPHATWQIHSLEDNDVEPATLSKISAFPKMIKDASRFVPLMAQAKYENSLWEIKTTMPRSEMNDSRPILFRMNHGIKNLNFVLGAKIDNIFEVTEELEGQI